MQENYNTATLVSFLNEYLPKLSLNIPTRINCGGCGFFAKHLHLVLKGMGIDSELSYSMRKTDEENINKLIRDNAYPRKTIFGFNHVAVNLKGYDYIDFDSTGITKPLTTLSKIDSSIHTGKISLEHLNILWENVGSWNPSFDRGYCSMIVELLNEIPQKYETFLKDGYVGIPKEIQEGSFHKVKHYFKRILNLTN